MDIKKIGLAVLGALLGVGAFAVVQAGGGKCDQQKSCCMTQAAEPQK